VAVTGTNRSREWGQEAIDADYGGIEIFSANVGFCRILSEFVGIYVLNSWEGRGITPIDVWD
jgi:hypothetical protein